MALSDYAKIAVISFIGIWVINRTLASVGLNEYRT